MLKRSVDLVFSSVGLLLLSPLFLLICIIIRINDKGPVFYLQERVGRHGKPFKLIKFRTMRVGSDKHAAITVGSRDPRITDFGFYLRKYKLDELPQLMNVMMADMSLVGPRPELQKFVDLYSAEQKAVLEIRPGMTDFASIQFRNENELLEGRQNPIQYYIQEIMPAKLRLNLAYIRNQSFWTDVKIILTTIWYIFKK